jgi:hypothetical protein
VFCHTVPLQGARGAAPPLRRAGGRRQRRADRHARQVSHVIAAPCLVNGGHGASLRHRNERHAWQHQRRGRRGGAGGVCRDAGPGHGHPARLPGAGGPPRTAAGRWRSTHARAARYWVAVPRGLHPLRPNMAGVVWLRFALRGVLFAGRGGCGAGGDAPPIERGATDGYAVAFLFFGIVAAA